MDDNEEMTTSRQRRKQKSGASTSSRSKRAAQKRIVRAPAVKGPAALRENWDRNATVRQNYQRLGLLGDLSMRDSGGAEQTYTTSKVSKPTTATTKSTDVKTQTAYVTRDANGKIVNVVERAKAPTQTAWGEALNEDEDGENDVGADEEEEVQGETARTVVSALERAAAQDAPVQRFTSDHEHAWLVSLIAKHGTDYEAMAHDRVGNVWQKTAGEIKRA